jgi:hypothetical protein
MGFIPSALGGADGLSSPVLSVRTEGGRQVSNLRRVAFQATALPS